MGNVQTVWIVALTERFSILGKVQRNRVLSKYPDQVRLSYECRLIESHSGSPRLGKLATDSVFDVVLGSRVEMASSRLPCIETATPVKSQRLIGAARQSISADSFQKPYRKSTDRRRRSPLQLGKEQCRVWGLKKTASPHRKSAVLQTSLSGTATPPSTIP